MLLVWQQMPFPVEGMLTQKKMSSFWKETARQKLTLGVSDGPSRVDGCGDLAEIGGQGRLHP